MDKKLRYLVVFGGILTLLLSACGAKKYYQSGDYNTAIRLAVKKLRKKPDHMKSMMVLEDAFSAAQNKDLSQINFLKKEGAPENWDKIFIYYGAIKKRQDLVKTLPHVPTGIKMINVEEDMISAKKNAAEYDYAKGVKLLQGNNREDARRAYDHFLSVKKYYSNFKDTDAKLREAQQKGTSYVLFSMRNKSGMIVPAAFEKEILRLNVNDLNGRWVVFHTNEQTGVPYHYHAKFDIMQLVVSPEHLKETSYEDTKKVKDGFDYVLDDKGNVMKDSLGNDIKVERTKTIRCKVIQTAQSKTARISGGLTIYSLETKQLLKNDPVTSDAIFEHHSAKAIGNKDALSAKSRKIIRNRPLPFPTHQALLMTGTDRLKGILKDIIYRHRGLFL